MPILKQIVTLTQTQYDYLVENGSITVEGATYYYNPNTLYMVTETGEEVMIQVDWNETDSSSPAYIRNKPTIYPTLMKTESLWNDDIAFVPERGQIIIYAQDQYHPYCRVKVGDGTSIVTTLPFIDAATIGGRAIKVGTTAEWDAQLSYVPAQGDIILYLDRATYDGVTYPGIKIGDGNAYCVDLPFIGDDALYNALQALTQHANNTDIHITSAERTFWNNKLNAEVVEEVLQLNRN